MVFAIKDGKFYRLNKSHIAVASRILAQSFHEDPIYVYILKLLNHNQFTKSW